MNRLSVLPCLLLALSLPAEAREVWRWVDANGVTHFSDTPQAGATRIELASGPSDAAATATAESAAAATRSPAPASRVQYESLEFTQPGNGETFFNSDATIPINLSLTPSLARGDSISVYVNGRRLEDFPETGLDYLLTGVERGAHSLTAVVSDADGNVLVRSQPRVFHLRQTSILNPNNPQNRPRPTPH